MTKHVAKRFCCLVIYANLHNLQCICIKMAVAGTFFIFPVIRTWQNMVWKVFLLFGDLCKSSQNTKIHHAWKDQTDLGNREK